MFLLLALSHFGHPVNRDWSLKGKNLSLFFPTTQMCSYMIWKGKAYVKYVVLRETPPIWDCLFTACVVIWHSFLLKNGSVLTLLWYLQTAAVCSEEDKVIYGDIASLAHTEWTYYQLYSIILPLAKTPKHLQLSASSQVPSTSSTVVRNLSVTQTHYLLT